MSGRLPLATFQFEWLVYKCSTVNGRLEFQELKLSYSIATMKFLVKKKLEKLQKLPTILVRVLVGQLHVSQVLRAHLLAARVSPFGPVVLEFVIVTTLLQQQRQVGLQFETAIVLRPERADFRF